LILLCTRSSEGKDWVEYEGAYADGQGVPLHVVLVSELDRDAIPEPHRDKVSVTLTNAPQVLHLLQRVAEQLAVEATIEPMDLARLIHLAHTDDVTRYEEALAAEKQRAAALVASGKQSFEISARNERRRWTLLLGVAVLSGAAAIAWLQRSFEAQLSATNGSWQETLYRQSHELNESRTAELMRFPLSGRLVLRGTPLRNTRLEVYRNMDGAEKPLATDNTDGTGAFSFSEGELPIDLKEQVDFVVRVAGRPLLRKVSPIEARLNVIFE